MKLCVSESSELCDRIWFILASSILMMNIRSSHSMNFVEILTIPEDFCVEFYTAVKHLHILFTARFRLNISDK